MTDDLRKKWIIVGFIWMGALLLTYLNSNKIDLIIQGRKAVQILQKDREFWKYNSGNIETILKKGASAYQNVESARLGLLSVETQLRSLAEKFDLKKFKMDSQPNQAGESGIPVDLFFSGSLEGAMHWLEAFEENYPYLKAARLKIAINQPVGQSDFMFSFYYRFKLSVQEDTG